MTHHTIACVASHTTTEGAEVWVYPKAKVAHLQRLNLIHLAHSPHSQTRPKENWHPVGPGTIALLL